MELLVSELMFGCKLSHVLAEEEKRNLVRLVA